jgi:Ca-activated chloride channel family protein
MRKARTLLSMTIICTFLNGCSERHAAPAAAPPPEGQRLTRVETATDQGAGAGTEGASKADPMAVLGAAARAPLDPAAGVTGERSPATTPDGDSARSAGILAALGAGDEAPAADKADGAATGKHERQAHTGQFAMIGGSGHGRASLSGRQAGMIVHGTLGAVGFGSGSGYGHGGGGMAAHAPSRRQDMNTESYTSHGVNGFVSAAEDRVSTFAIDVDTASYAIFRRKIREGAMPPPAAVRVEEFINYFQYQYPGPGGDEPFAVHMDMAPSPLTPGRQLLRVGVQARRLSHGERKPSHLVFLVDVSGSMQSADKLELAKRSLRLLVNQMRAQDTVALVTYAGHVRVVLEPTTIARNSTSMVTPWGMNSGNMNEAMNNTEISGTPRMSSM